MSEKIVNMKKKLSGASPAEKLLRLYTLLLVSTEPLSLRKMSQILHCSKQTVLRLLGQLEASQYCKLDPPIRRGREDFYRLNSSQEQALNLGINELSQLALCRNMLASILPDVISKNFKKGDKKRGVSFTVNPLGGVAQIYTKGYIDYSPYKEQYATFLEAIKNKQLCTVTYTKRPIPKERVFTFAPIRLISFHEALYILGWEVNERVEIRHEDPLYLCLHRCVEVTLTGRSADSLPELPENDSENTVTPFGILHGSPFTVRLLFDESAAGYIFDRKWSAEQTIDVQDNGSLILTISVQSQLEIVSWILSFGGSVTVLEPLWLKEKIVEEAGTILGNYDG
ncbi:MAG: WYL domain-containing protein [Desulfovibrionaceae bacterium]|nr:WYL domain-containing protein [Desulfovibrionaceae bacterium]